MMKRTLLVFALLAPLFATSGSARADEAAPAAPAAEGANPLGSVSFDKYKLDREKGDISLDKGRLFLADLKAANPSAWASVTDAVRYDIQTEETRKFAHQKQFVIYAYGAIWVILLGFVVGLYARQRQLNAELAELERRISTEKK
jgi:CcmD family protein